MDASHGIAPILSLALLVGLDSTVQLWGQVRRPVPAMSTSTVNRIGLDGHAQEPVPKEVPAPKEDPEPPPRVATHGRVKFRDGKPAARAFVSVAGPNEFRAEIYADESGQFELEGPEGAYSLDIQAGDRQEQFSATIAEGRLVPAEFTLK